MTYFFGSRDRELQNHFLGYPLENLDLFSHVTPLNILGSVKGFDRFRNKKHRDYILLGTVKQSVTKLEEDFSQKFIGPYNKYLNESEDSE